MKGKNVFLKKVDRTWLIPSELCYNVFQLVRLNHEPYDKTSKNPPGKASFTISFIGRKSRSLVVAKTP